MSSAAEAALDRRSTQDLTALIAQATDALARLDVGRLEGLALSCEALADLSGSGADELPRDNGAREAGKAMRVFSRMLEVTRANLEFMRRLREGASGRMEYRPGWAAEWSIDGNH